MISQLFTRSILASVVLTPMLACSENPSIIDENSNQILPSAQTPARPDPGNDCNPEQLLENEEQCDELANAPDLEDNYAAIFKVKSPPAKQSLDTGTNSKTNTSTATPAENPNQLISDTVDFDAFCVEAATVKSSESPGIASLLAEACQNGRATALFSDELIKNAHKGDGQIKFHIIDPLSSNNQNQTSVVVAFAFALPTSAKDYFDRLAPRNLEAAGVKEIVEGAGGSATVTIEKKLANVGPHHERGALVDQKLVKTVVGIQVTVHSKTQYDQYNLAAPTAYLNTSRIDQAISGIIASDTLTAIVQKGTQAYYMQFWRVITPNRGRPGIAEPELGRVVVTTANTLYQRINRQAQQ